MDEIENFISHFKDDIGNTDYSIEEVRKRVQFLAQKLGTEYLMGPVTKKIKGDNPLISLIEFSENLELVSLCKGFDRFMEEYQRVKKDYINRNGWEFELEVASYLIKCGFSVELKPEIKGRTPDIKICNEDVFVECKNWLSDSTVMETENKLGGICYAVIKNISHNVDIGISLNKYEIETENILKEVENLLASEKKVFQNANFLIDVKEGSGKKKSPLHIITTFYVENIKTSTRRVGMWVGNGQTSVRVTAPEFSLTKKIVQIFNDARKQLPKNESNIIVININRFLGKFDDFHKIIAMQFKSKNTRCSGVLLFEHFINNVLEKSKLSYRATFINNTHACKPLSEDFTFKISTFERKTNTF